MTMTFAEATRIIDGIEAALQSDPNPRRAAFDASTFALKKQIARMDKIARIQKFIPKFAFDLLTKLATGDGYDEVAGEVARKKVLQKHPIFLEYNILEIDSALKLGIANMYLGFSSGLVPEQPYNEYVKVSIFTVGLGGWMEIVDSTTMQLTPELDSTETAESFAKFCAYIGADDPEFWRKVYERIGLEYDSTSPPGNFLS